MFRKFFRNRFGQKSEAYQSSARHGSGRGASQGQDRHGFGRGAGGGNKPGSGPGGDCVCPKCGKRVPHVAGQRCLDQVCPDCSTRMVRE
jgi:hypothetical protein